MRPVVNVSDFLTGVIRPTLEHLSHRHPEIRHDENVESLLLGTAIQESRLVYLFQNDGDDDEYDGGLGFYQMEAATHESIWNHYLDYRPDLSKTVKTFASARFCESNKLLNRELVTNLAYATVMARLVYLPVPHSVPDNLAGWAKYWKQNYNTSQGKGTEEEFMRNYRSYAP